MSRRAIRFATLVAFGLVFEGCILLASHAGHPPQFDTLILVALILAASLVGRALAYLTIFEWVRHPFTRVVPHSSGAGEDVLPLKAKKNDPAWKAVREVVGAWISCPICAGTWGALGLVLFYTLDPVGGKVLIFTLAAASAGSILTRLVETIEWAGHLTQELTGRHNRINKAGYDARLEWLKEAEARHAGKVYAGRNIDNGRR